MKLIVTWFESDVILNGSQTNPMNSVERVKFESDVILNGSQTRNWA